MTKSVVWNSCGRLACASAQSPDVVLCLTPGLIAPISCADDTEYSPSTIDAVLQKVWKDGSACGSGNFRYLFTYDESLLTDPTTTLTTAQVLGAFCKGCMTDWIEDKLSCLQSEVVGAVIPLYSNMCANTPCGNDGESSVVATYTIPEVFLTEQGQRIEFKATVNLTGPGEDEVRLLIDFDGTTVALINIDVEAEVNVSIKGSVNVLIGPGINCLTYESTVITDNSSVTPVVLYGHAAVAPAPHILTLTFSSSGENASSCVNESMMSVDFYDTALTVEGFDCCD